MSLKKKLVKAGVKVHADRQEVLSKIDEASASISSATQELEAARKLLKQGPGQPTERVQRHRVTDVIDALGVAGKKLDDMRYVLMKD